MGRISWLAILLIANSDTYRSRWPASGQLRDRADGEIACGNERGNPVLLTRTADGKMVGGVAFEVGKFIAEKLGVSFELVRLRQADTYTQSFGKGEWDIGFGARTPLVADKADFVLDLVLADYAFVAAPGPEFADAAQVDRPGVKIGVGRNSSSDQFLSRTLKSAELVRCPAAEAIEALRSGKADVWAASASNAQEVADAGSRRQGCTRSVHQRPVHVDTSERTIICGSGQNRRDRQ